LLAQNTLLQSAVDRLRAKASDLRSILCSIDMATLCVCRGLKLRQFTAAAGHLLGIGPEHVGLTLSLRGCFDLDGTLMARLKAVLGSGIGQTQVIAVASGQLVRRRLLPLRAFGTANPAIDGVVITFALTDPADCDVQTLALPDHDLADRGQIANQKRDHGALVPVNPGLASGLTQRQQQVLGHVLAGHPSKNIAADLGISQRTVENHRAAIMARTGATSLPALARLAMGVDVGGDCKPAHRLCD
jgi:DNA-binding CsgD family transcriptional regulator